MSEANKIPRRHLSQARVNQGLIRPIYAAVFDLDPAKFSDVRNMALKWLENHRTVRAFLSASRDHDNFEINRLRDNDGLLAEVATSPQGNITLIRLQHQEQLADGRYDPARNWRTEVTLERDEAAAWLAVRTWFAGVASDYRSCAPPRFIKDLWRAGHLSDLDILTPKSRILEFDPEADALADLIQDSDRDFPVVVIADGSPLDPDRLAENATGLAHVFKISRGVRFRLIQSLNYEFELSHGAIQTFYPRIKSSPIFAPAAKFETVIAWRFEGENGPGAFASWLHEEMGRAVVLRLLNDSAHRTIESLKAAALEDRRTALLTSVPDITRLSSELQIEREFRGLLESEIKALQDQVLEITDRAEQFSIEAGNSDESLRAERAKNHSLQQQNAALHYALAAKNGSTKVSLTDAEIQDLINQQPNQANAFEAVEQAKLLFELYGLPVIVTDTALEAAMDSPFRRPNEILETLLKLGFYWNELKAIQGPLLVDRVRERIGCKCSLHESQTTMSKFGDERRLRYDGRDLVFEKHLTLGGGPQNVQTTAQIYFGDKDGEVLIGHVGRHLRVSNTQ